MIKDMKELELNEQEMDSVTGGDMLISIPRELVDSIDQEKIKEPEEPFYETVGTMWEVVKHVHTM